MTTFAIAVYRGMGYQPAPEQLETHEGLLEVYLSIVAVRQAVKKGWGPGLLCLQRRRLKQRVRCSAAHQIHASTGGDQFI